MDTSGTGVPIATIPVDLDDVSELSGDYRNRTIRVPDGGMTIYLVSADGVQTIRVPEEARRIDLVAKGTQ